MGRDKANENRTDQFAKWVLAHRLLPAWKALSFPARDAYFHLHVRCFAETAQRKRSVVNNNGQIYRSPRKLAEDMGCSVKTALAALADLQAKGWIECTNPWTKTGEDGRGRTAHFRLTMLGMGNGPNLKPATYEPKRWIEGEDYEVQVYGSYLPKPRKARVQNLKRHPPNRTHGCSQVGHADAIGKAKTVSNSSTKNGQSQQSRVANSGTYLIASSKRSESDGYTPSIE